MYIKLAFPEGSGLDPNSGIYSHVLDAAEAAAHQGADAVTARLDDAAMANVLAQTTNINQAANTAAAAAGGAMRGRHHCTRMRSVRGGCHGKGKSGFGFGFMQGG